jgi:hypothetical protein
MLGETSVLIKCQVIDHSGFQFLQCKYVLNVVLVTPAFSGHRRTNPRGVRRRPLVHPSALAAG